MTAGSIINRIIQEHLTRLHEAIEAACYASMDADCGVKVVIRDDASYSVGLDPSVPPLHVYEYRPGGRVVGYGFDPYKLPYIEKMLFSSDTPGNGA